jgi:transposase
VLLTHRKLLQAKAIAVDNNLRATLRNFGLKVGVVGAVKFEARINELIENLPDWRR